MIEFSGPGLHSGSAVRIRIRPAPTGHGIKFCRVDIDDADPLVPASWSDVVPSRLCTVLANDDGVEASTVEHVMAALAGCGVHNALVEIDGPELPILDGSAAPYVAAILRTGLAEQDQPITVLEITREISVRQGPTWARIAPGPGFQIDFRIEFPDQAIGQQSKLLDLANGTFVRELCDSRTFCRLADVEAMRAAGLARGGTLANALVVDGDEILTPGGARHNDEAVRHKMLDALGDLALAGAPILGRFTAHRGGHALTNRLLHRLFASPDAYRLRPATAAEALRLPGIGVHQGDLRAVA